MFKTFKNNPKKYHTLLYCLSFVIYGTFLTGLGPLIPFLAENSNVAETEYSYFFTLRAVGFVIGATLVKFIE